jgi:hypothetical protein
MRRALSARILIRFNGGMLTGTTFINLEAECVMHEMRAGTQFVF